MMAVGTQDDTGVSSSIPFCKPWVGDEEADAVAQVLKSGWLSRGPKCEEFEAALCDFTGAKYAISLSSCTAALHLALLCHNIGPGDEVLVPAMTFPATINAVLYTGAKPVLVDCWRDYNWDVCDAVKKLTRRTKATVGVDMHGSPCNAHITLRSIPFIQDAAHSLGAVTAYGKVGSYANATCLSFYATKNLTTGDGGALLTNKSEIAEKARMLSLHGMDAGAWKRYSPESQETWQIGELGYKYNMTDIQAAIGIEQLKKLPKALDLRYQLAQEYDRFLQPLADQGLITLPPRKGCWHLYAVRIHNTYCNKRDVVLKQLKERGIGCGVHFRSIEQHHFYQKRLGLKKITCPTAYTIGCETLSLPLYPQMSLFDVSQVCKTLQEVLEG
jgi:dTDP-4-amino-4,6-dideoxygalactose transaminase